MALNITYFFLVFCVLVSRVHPRLFGMRYRGDTGSAAAGNGGAPFRSPPSTGPGLRFTRLAPLRLRAGLGADPPGQALQVGVLGEQRGHGRRPGGRPGPTRGPAGGGGRGAGARRAHTPGPRAALAGSTTCACAAPGSTRRGRGAGRGGREALWAAGGRGGRCVRPVGPPTPGWRLGRR